MNKVQIQACLAVIFALGIASQALAKGAAEIKNNTEFTIEAKAKSWQGLLNGKWEKVLAGKSNIIHPGGQDCIDGVWLKIKLPGKELQDLAFCQFIPKEKGLMELGVRCGKRTFPVSISLKETTDTTYVFAVEYLQKGQKKVREVPLTK